MKKEFSEEEIAKIRAKVKSGADFPREIQEFKEIGIISYDFLVESGECIYFGEENYSLKTPSEYKNFPYEKLKTSLVASKEKLQNSLIIHQKGKTDFPTFCVQAALSGVKKWKIDLKEMACIYFDSNKKEILRENIPNA